MAAYPFFPAPTLATFVQIATTKYGAEEFVSKTPVKRGGEEHFPRYLVRQVDGKASVAVLPNVGDFEGLTPHLLRSLCDRLRIPLKDFGFTITDDGIDLNPENRN